MFKYLERARPDLTGLQRIAYGSAGRIDPDGRADLTGPGIPLVSFRFDDVNRCVNGPRTQGECDARSQPAAAAGHDDHIRACPALLNSSCNLRTEGVTPGDHLYAFKGVQVAPTSFVSFHSRAVRQVRALRDLYLGSSLFYLGSFECRRVIGDDQASWFVEFLSGQANCKRKVARSRCYDTLPCVSYSKERPRNLNDPPR